MKIILSNKETDALKDLSRVVRQISNGFNKNSKKKIERVQKTIKSDSDKWGRIDVFDDKTEMNIVDDAFIEYIAIFKNMAIKYSSIIDTVLGFGSFMKEMTGDFERRWTNRRYIKIRSMTARHITDMDISRLESLEIYDVRQSWEVISYSGVSLTVFRDDEDIFIFSKNNLIQEIQYHISSSTENKQRDAERRRIDSVLEKDMDLHLEPTAHYEREEHARIGKLREEAIVKETKEFKEYYVMPDEDLLTILKVNNVVRDNANNNDKD